jgi:hypothetical protein
MVLIRIDDEVWEKFRSSWAMFGVKTEEKLIRMLEDQIWENSLDCLANAEKELIDDSPEAYFRREIGMEKEKKRSEKEEKSTLRMRKKKTAHRAR